jgi:hypothetical protein
VLPQVVTALSLDLGGWAWVELGVDDLSLDAVAGFEAFCVALARGAGGEESPGLLQRPRQAASPHSEQGTSVGCNGRRMLQAIIR